MKTIYTRISMALALLAVAPMSYAGFFFESAPAPAPAPVQQVAKVRGVDGRIPVASTTAGARNVNPSASGERIAKMNRQRIDLESRVSSRITQSGNSPTELQSLRGLGRRVTFEDALRQVLPAGWQVYSDQEAPLDKVVDWDGGRTWPMVMHAMLTTLDMRAHIDWDAQELMLFVPAPLVNTEKPAELVATADGTPVVPPESAPVAAPMAAAPVAAPILNPKRAPTVDVKDVVWTIKPGNLRENLRALAAQAGWTLVWNATIGDMTVNYDVEAPGYQFTGALIGSDGVLAKVIDLYAQAEHPLAVTFYHGNKVVEVRLHEVPDMKPAAAAQVVAPSRAAAPVAAGG